MRIVFLSPRFYPDIGGVEKHAFEVAKILAKKNDVTVITEDNKDRKENINKIKIIRLYFGRKDWVRKYIIWSKLLKLRKVIEKADVVHCHDVFFWYLPLRIIYPKKKVFITFHGYETIFPPKASAIFIRRLSQRLSNGNIAIGEYIQKWYGTKPNFVLYGGSDNGIKIVPKQPKRKKIKILFVGRIEEDTGVKTYIKVLDTLRNYRFEACGDGSLKNKLERYGKVHGFVKNLDEYFIGADLVFASSYLSMISAMKFRKPVFSVFENSLKEDYLKLTPFEKWIYTAKSYKVLVRKIKVAIRNKRLKEKNINLAYNWAITQTWENIARKYMDLWNKKI